jgi:hypothetical protein
MGHSNSYRKAVSKWLGFAADFASSVTSGSPIGVTTDIPAEAPDKARSGGKEVDNRGIERDSSEPTTGTGPHQPEKPST